MAQPLRRLIEITRQLLPTDNQALTHTDRPTHVLHRLILLKTRTLRFLPILTPHARTLRQAALRVEVTHLQAPAEATTRPVHRAALPTLLQIALQAVVPTTLTALHQEAILPQAQAALRTLLQVRAEVTLRRVQVAQATHLQALADHPTHHRVTPLRATLHLATHHLLHITHLLAQAAAEATLRDNLKRVVS